MNVHFLIGHIPEAHRDHALLWGDQNLTCPSLPTPRSAFSHLRPAHAAEHTLALVGGRVAGRIHQSSLQCMSAAISVEFLPRARRCLCKAVGNVVDSVKDQAQDMAKNLTQQARQIADDVKEEASSCFDLAQSVISAVMLSEELVFKPCLKLECDRFWGYVSVEIASVKVVNRWRKAWPV